MIERNGDERTLACDDCQEVFATFDKDDFASLIREARENGWEIQNGRSGWTHRCGDCRHNDSRLAQAQRKFGITPPSQSRP